MGSVRACASESGASRGTPQSRSSAQRGGVRHRRHAGPDRRDARRGAGHPRGAARPRSPDPDLRARGVRDGEAGCRGPEDGAGRCCRHLGQPRSRGVARRRRPPRSAGRQVRAADRRWAPARSQRRPPARARLPHRGQGHHLHHPLPRVAPRRSRPPLSRDADRAAARTRGAGIELRPDGTRGAPANRGRQGGRGRSACAAAGTSPRSCSSGTTRATSTRSARRRCASRFARRKPRGRCSPPPMPSSTARWT